jgi:hypothetical protein
MKVREVEPDKIYTAKQWLNKCAPEYKESVTDRVIHIYIKE